MYFEENLVVKKMQFFLDLFLIFLIKKVLHLGPKSNVLSAPV